MTTTIYALHKGSHHAELWELVLSSELTLYLRGLYAFARLPRKRTWRITLAQGPSTFPSLVSGKDHHLVQNLRTPLAHSLPSGVTRGILEALLYTCWCERPDRMQGDLRHTWALLPSEATFRYHLSQGILPEECYALPDTKLHEHPCLTQDLGRWFNRLDALSITPPRALLLCATP